MARDRIDIGNGYELSIQNGKYNYCTQGETVELAIFKDGEWFAECTEISSLERKADCDPTDNYSMTRVFGHVTMEELIEVCIHFGDTAVLNRIDIKEITNGI